MNTSSCLRNINDGLVDVVRKLSKKYDFEFDEGVGLLKLSIPTVPVKPLTNKPTNIPLPFCGVIFDTCVGIKLNHGLYTQCLSKRTSGDLCKVCYNQSVKNTSGKPTYGLIHERLDTPYMEFKDPKGKCVVNYGNVMEKLGISREQAEDIARKQGIIIPEEQFAVKKKTRGRPKKSAESNTSPKELVQESDSDSDSESEQVRVVEIKYRGVKYYKSLSDNKVYNTESEEVGIWDNALSEIVSPDVKKAKSKKE